MTRQSDKTGTIRTTKRLSPTSAGEIRSTSEDTSGWGTDASSNVIDNGRLALSTSSSTTITACETLYPELWANTPTGWRSGSNLVVPSQGNTEIVDAGATVNWTAITGLDSISSSSVVAIQKVGRLVTVSGNVNLDTNTTGAVSFSFPKSDLPYDMSGNRMSGTIFRDSAPNTSNYGHVFGDTGSTKVVFNIDGNTNTTGSLQWTFVFSYHTLDADINTSETTPYIQAYNNVANAQSIPPATATEAGSVSAEDSGTLSLTLTNNSGLDSTPTLGNTEYHRVGNMVFCWFEMTIDPTASGAFTVTFPRSELPAGPKNYTITGNCWKSGANDSNNNGNVAQLLSNTVYVSGNSTTTTSHTYRVAFNYMIE